MTPTDLTQARDPRQQYPVPPFDQQQPINPPGQDAQMNPMPDYGEHSYRGSGRLTGRKALITGAYSGIGRAVALAFAREGADVLVWYLDESGRNARAVKGDIQQERQATGLEAADATA